MITKTKCGKIFISTLQASLRTLKTYSSTGPAVTGFSRLLGDKSECYVRRYGGQKQLRKPGQ